MNREEAKIISPFMTALVEGKTVQYCDDYEKDIWRDLENVNIPAILNRPEYYRIKPESTYRPFKNAEECWNEMQKHKPFGWVKHTSYNEYFYSILEVTDDGCVFAYGPVVPFNEVYEFNTFADGTPFGMKEE